MSDDGSPSVAFPNNFDQVVGLMGRKELLTPADKQESMARVPNALLKGISNGVTRAREIDSTQHATPPPWTKYLLEEGIDRTKAFSRYRGMFAGGKGREDAT